mmetsp:Transcript_37702/g.61977  ORF Transcript_37702/g.61977 Transcript_37702/m.61977 type:complete len:641 (-) Transcript_37702:83-2005(-)|eukprot:CAMPEP_0202714176 /NCGR_PEP_ID=MMETSP1385-20130828/65047_1 /ASSEMBLY_ACC=CAM_ASM_000861 /TAXON_ID=933848 /ORGANISM="Elphidium margaritaceum" /LENGTH=640 /DNA_ID=CAMNT_0049374813 /DNA_START=24 /DNA_END=1946 /DNA_ORIENTATION=-
MQRLNRIIKHMNTDNETKPKARPVISSSDLSNQYGGFLIAKVLQSEGVESIFTLTGGHISPMLVGCNKLGIKVIDVRDEVTTVFAADAVGRLTGKPGVAMVTAGPGLTNTITATKNAQMAESPCIIFGGATSMLLKGRGSLQDIDQFALMRPHVKKCFTLKRVRDIIPTLREAFYLSNHGIPGPVFIETPLEILWPRSEIELSTGGSDSDKQSKPKSWLQQMTNLNIAELYTRYHIHRVFKDGFKDWHNINADDKYKYITQQEASAASTAKVPYNAMLNQLIRSKRPLLVLGSQAMLHPMLVTDLIAAIEQLSMPVFLSGMSRGLLGKHHALFFRHKRSAALAKCDFVILCGISCDFRLNYGRSINKDAFFVHVNLDGQKLRINRDLRRRQLAVQADACKVLIKLAECKKDLGVALAFKDWTNELAKREMQREQNIDVGMKKEMSVMQAGTMNAINLCRMLDDLLNDEEDTYLIADGGDFVGTASYLVKPRQPLHWLDPGAFGTLGCGAGFALGVKALNPKANVVMLYGDGSFGWSLCEFDTFCRFKYGLIAIIGNDSCWHQMYRDQVRILKDTTATLLGEHTRYDLVVQGFGCKGFVARNANEFVTAFKEAQKYAKQGIPVVINALISKSKFREGSVSL